MLERMAKATLARLTVHYTEIPVHVADQQKPYAFVGLPHELAEVSISFVASGRPNVLISIQFDFKLQTK